MKGMSCGTPSQLHSPKSIRDFCFWKGFGELFHTEHVQMAPLSAILQACNHQMSGHAQSKTAAQLCMHAA